MSKLDCGYYCLRCSYRTTSLSALVTHRSNELNYGVPYMLMVHGLHQLFQKVHPPWRDDSVHMPAPKERFLPLRDVAEITGISVSALWERITRGTLPAERDEVNHRDWWVAEHVVEKIEKGVSLKHGN